MNIYGLAIIHNGAKFDFPFIESLQSMAPFVKSIVINYGECTDETLPRLQALRSSLMTPLEILHSKWDMSRKDRGLIFSDETNRALKWLRDRSDRDYDDRDAWVIYLQSDEIIHKQDFEVIRRDLQLAEESGCDVVRFRYIHFWQEHNKIAINKKWYPQEIRALRLFSDVLSYGDAQTFYKYKKIYDSDAHIYHYGHVREKSAYREKVDNMIRFYHANQDYQKYARKWKRRDRCTETLDYFGPHPQVIHERIKRLGGVITLPEVERVYIVGKDITFSPETIQRIACKKVIFVSSLKDVPKAFYPWTIVFYPRIRDKIFHRSLLDVVPLQMRSPLARAWSQDFVLMLKLSAKGISLK
ncbi:MAG: hypothetical protein HQK53_08325 [Oligoflexia bacterium]|nr:hypothetical protein [Oligoflexia bacterium]